MSNTSRNKGRAGEAEVARIWREHGFDVRGLEGEGDHVVSRSARYVSTTHGRVLLGGPLLVSAQVTIHSEVKRCETARPWAWYEQASCEAPAGSVPVVAFRRNRSGWLALIALDDLARLLA